MVDLWKIVILFCLDFSTINIFKMVYMSSRIP